MPILVGSRGSDLARTQVRQYLELLAPLCPGVEFKRRVITEAGDRDRVSLLANVAGRSAGSAFSSRLETALAAGEIDVAVHSLQDLPTSMPDGLVLLAPPGREAVEDALCGSTLARLPHGARVGTGAPRRAALLRAARPDLELVPIRGNVPGRLHGVDLVHQRQAVGPRRRGPGGSGPSPRGRVRAGYRGGAWRARRLHPGAANP